MKNEEEENDKDEDGMRMRTRLWFYDIATFTIPVLSKHFLVNML